MNIYYVYCYLDPRKPGNYFYENLDMCFLYEPFYIGKGKDTRIKAHLYKSNINADTLKTRKIKKIFESNQKPISIYLETNLTEEIAFEFEREYISKIGRHDLNTGPLSNMNSGGSGTHSSIVESKRKKVYQYDLEGNLINEYKSITIAAESNNLDISSISHCCNKSAKTHGGYIWSFNNEIHDFKLNDNFNKINQYDINDNFIKTWDSITAASNELNIKYDKISCCCRHRAYKSIDGFYFRYINDPTNYIEPIVKERRIVQLINDNIIIYENINDASKILNISIRNIDKRCKNDKYHDHICLMYKKDYDNGIRKIKGKERIPYQAILKIDMNGNIIEEYISIVEAANKNNIHRTRLANNMKKNNYIDNYLYTKKINYNI